ncbi:TetR/AcrR family transcriptional regulator [Budviciaceae bacterium CWB-B4]|uniref:TetR/AcrR family transcriptional regulator n=1 Tax=Limnobaculum xujianqingii TaxID=2738837 RepID=A0A9D7FZ48_9GAMM|nr:TetR/AcrR family transcriptional regulator [Limnobaculum xujianqingii]MBK5074519.1 TetR/AcrR family transcriptional regulator [Limnobaculum xujianqingii]MBK5177815.1 TetR/AcrR family transcriptional regulator [Limnobaculum xujianqingii]
MGLSKEDRRTHILQKATDIFLNHGYERTSMDEVNECIGCSKATLYKYFSSKQELFINVIDHAVHTYTQVIINTTAQLQNRKIDCWQSLHNFGVSYLNLHLSPVMMKITRMIIAECEHTGIGELMYQRGPQKGWMKISTHLESLMERGILRHADPFTTAMQFKGLLESGLIDKQLRGAISNVSEEEVHRQASNALDTFRRAYEINQDAISINMKMNERK